MSRPIEPNQDDKRVSSLFLDYLEKGTTLEELSAAVPSSCAGTLKALAVECKKHPSPEAVASVVLQNTLTLQGLSKILGSRANKLKKPALQIVSDFYSSHKNYFGEDDASEYRRHVHILTGIPRKEDTLAIAKWKLPNRTKDDNEFDALKKSLDRMTSNIESYTRIYDV